ncbi:hypothetical protein [Streptomyces sp. NPDC047079]|uniref:hypothetical protein n=1 Tax=Streptomyces sp. NPDC047079 TaxID=3154607 RepID=UPI0033DC3324
MDDRLHTVVGLSGTTVRLLDEAGSASLVLLSHLLVSEGFELIGQEIVQGRMPPIRPIPRHPAGAPHEPGPDHQRRL